MAQAMVQAMDGPWPGHGPIAQAMAQAMDGQCSRPWHRLGAYPPGLDPPGRYPLGPCSRPRKCHGQATALRDASRAGHAVHSWSIPSRSGSSRIHSWKVPSWRVLSWRVVSWPWPRSWSPAHGQAMAQPRRPSHGKGHGRAMAWLLLFTSPLGRARRSLRSCSGHGPHGPGHGPSMALATTTHPWSRPWTRPWLGPCGGRRESVRLRLWPRTTSWYGRRPWSPGNGQQAMVCRPWSPGRGPQACTLQECTLQECALQKCALQEGALLEGTLRGAPVGGAPVRGHPSGRISGHPSGGPADLSHLPCLAGLMP